MTKEQLLIPRWKVIADYPDNENYEVGEILDRDWCRFIDETDESSGTVWRISEFPHLFKRLAWHEDRQLSDMPEYVKDIDNGKIYKVASPEQNGRIWHVDGEMEHWHLLRWANKYTPIDKEEYDSFIQNQQP